MTMRHDQAMQEYARAMTRRQLLANGRNVVGSAALASLLGSTAGVKAAADRTPGPHFAPKAKHVIYLHMVGGPSQMDLFDHKPVMQKDWFDKDLPESIRMGQRLTTMTSGQARFPIAPSVYNFKRHGQSGMWVSELLPNTAKMVDEMCFIRSMHTEAINHEPAITMSQTGNQIAGKPCIGAWSSYGLGAVNENLPTFVVMVAIPTNREQEQAISARLWSAGFLPGEHAGVSLRSSGDPILYIKNPPGVPAHVRRRTLDGLQQMNQMNERMIGDPQTTTRIQQYELAYRMQSSVPELTDLSQESDSTFELYGEDARQGGTFANTALMARRMVQRGVRFVQIYHNNWDHHGNLTGRMDDQCKDVDRATYGLLQDLKQRGMLEDTLVVWGGEFGRTIYSQGELTKTNYGRDHHPRCFTMWMAGGGSKPGTVYGETDEFSYNITKDPVHVNELNATILNLLGFNNNRFAYPFQGLEQRLTGVEHVDPVPALMA
ncbi:MAG: DUF1501 domain-containing protein [Phycisphaeraceae bacterium]